MFWTRFGTPTARAESGTIEEFERARSRWEEDPKSIDVMFYFKDEPIAPSKIEPDQLGKVQQFRKSISPTALYGSFVTPEDLGRLVRIHLNRRMIARAATKLRRVSETPETLPQSRADVRSSRIAAGEASAGTLSEEDTGEEPEEGLLDLVEGGSGNIQSVAGVLGRMTDTMNEFSDHLVKARKDIERATSGDRPDYKRAKKALNTLADHMRNIASQFEADISLFRGYFDQGMNAYVKMTRVTMDFGEKAIEATEENRGATVRLVRSSQSAAEMVAGLRNSTEALPRLTTEFNRSKKRLLSVLARVQREFEAATTLGQEAVAAVDEILATMESARSEDQDS